MDKRTMDKGGEVGTEIGDCNYFKIINGKLYTISPDHVYRSDLRPRVNIADALIELDGETFKITSETV